jgi:hypothetical protein
MDMVVEVPGPHAPDAERLGDVHCVQSWSTHSDSDGTLAAL